MPINSIFDIDPANVLLIYAPIIKTTEVYIVIKLNP